MNALPLAANLGSLIAGAGLVIAAFRLDRTFRLPVLRHYLGYIILAVVSGFFDWIVVGLLGLMAPGLSAVQSDAVYHVFWDLVGFPGAMAAACFLLWTLMGLLKIRLDRRRKAWTSSPFVLLGLMSFFYAVLRTGQAGGPLGLILWNGFLYGLPVFQVLILSAALIRAVGLREGAGLPLRLFLLSLLGGHLVWYGLSLVASPWHPSYRVTIIWYFLMLAPPTLALAAHFRVVERREILESPGPEDLAPVVREFGLTPREADVLVLLLAGKSYQAMKSELFLSLQTVKNHVSRIYGKTGVRNRIELVNKIRNVGRR
jgi:DNA-binding CsgD family transcriptional regulator